MPTCALNFPGEACGKDQSLLHDAVIPLPACVEKRLVFLLPTLGLCRWQGNEILTLVTWRSDQQQKKSLEFTRLFR